MPSAVTSRAETAAALNAVKARGGKIVAVGTTSLRLLESAAGEDGRLAPFDGADESVHYPGLSLPLRRSALDQFPFAALDPVHAGRSFSGLDLMQRAYAHAVEARYRFYSYGDACLLSPARAQR